MRDGLEVVNHKRVYRLMKEHDLLLTRAPVHKENRIHNGRLVAAGSDQRWCSDGFELSCQHGEKVRSCFH